MTEGFQGRAKKEQRGAMTKQKSTEGGKVENYRKRFGGVGWDNAHCVVVLCFLEQRLNMGAEGTFGDMVQ